MADYRHIMSLLLRGYSYRDVQALAGCSHRTIAKARQILDAEAFTTDEQVQALTAQDVDRLFTDGRKTTSSDFVPIDIEAVVSARIGRKKPPLKVLWARYLQSPASEYFSFWGPALLRLGATTGKREYCPWEPPIALPGATQ